MNIVTLIMGILGGCCIGMQGGINAQLTIHYSKNPLLAAAISFTVGAIGLGALVLIMRIPFPILTDILLWWHWTGGFLGAYSVLLFNGELFHLSIKCASRNIEISGSLTGITVTSLQSIYNHRFITILN